jgi:hypothetical protein
MNATQAGLVTTLAVELIAVTACGGGSAVERAVADRNRGQLDSVSCTQDHNVRIGGRNATVYRCFAHGGNRDGEEICVIWRDGRLLGGRELARVPLTDLLCEGQG